MSGKSDIRKIFAQGSSRETLKKVMRYIGGYRLLLGLSMLLAAGNVILTLYIPILFGNAIDGIVSAGQVHLESVLFYLKETALLMAAAALMQWIMNTLNNRIAYHVVRDIRGEAFRKLQKLPLSYLDAHPSGDIVSRLTADADQLSDGLLMGFTQLFSGMVTIAATLIFMFSRSIEISLLVIILTPLSFAVARFIAGRTYAMFKKQSSVRGELTALTEEMIGNGKVVRAFGYEGRASKRFARWNEELEESSRQAVFFSSLTNPCTRFVNSVIYAVVALTGAFLVLSGRLTVGGLSVMLSYANQYTKPFNEISSVMTELQNALACAGRVFELLEQPEEAEGGSLTFENTRGEIRMEDICFSYDPARPLIEHLNVSADPGMRVAIVGPTGCGKTTLINLLMRFYDADSGRILMDGSNIYEGNRKKLRKNYGMVLQETWLKEATVRENITFGKPEASEEEIITACKEAHSWSFIRRLPKGLDTVLKEDSLSQGQKQLLCITRVMLCLPPMLILDEATSSIDTRTEIRIQEAFGKLMQGRTSFIVAHRLSTIRSADVILVMKDGRIVEQGSHEQLLKKDGFYAALCAGK